MGVAPLCVGLDVRLSGAVEADPLGPGGRPPAAHAVHVTREALEVVGVRRVVLAVEPGRPSNAEYVRRGRLRRRSRRDVGVDEHGVGIVPPPAVPRVRWAPRTVGAKPPVRRVDREEREAVAVGPVGEVVAGSIPESPTRTPTRRRRGRESASRVIDVGVPVTERVVDSEKGNLCIPQKDPPQD